MSLAIVDAREWQRLFDLKTGKKVEDSRPQTLMLRRILERHPYPGDVDILSNRWVTDCALELIREYEPGLACVMYAHQYFSGRYTPMTEDQRTRMIENVFDEIERLTTESGYTPVIVGTGDMVPIEGEIDLSKMDGLAISSHWSARYAGLHFAGARDLDYAAAHPKIEKIIRRDEWIAAFPDAPCCQPERVPEYLLLAREGWLFATTGTPSRKALRVPGTAYRIPLSTPLGEASSLTEIRNLIDAAGGDRKIILIIVEGVGIRDFPISYTPCSNQTGWHYYEPGECFYLTLSTGTHQVFAYPSGYQYLDETDAKQDFPFSGYFTDIPEHTIGYGFPGKSIAAGNHSMFVHMVFGADICVECFARNLYNQGGFGVIHRFR